MPPVLIRSWLAHLLVVCSHVSDPRELAVIFSKAEAELASKKHPDPYIRTWPTYSAFVPFVLIRHLQPQQPPVAPNGVSHIYLSFVLVLILH